MTTSDNAQRATYAPHPIADIFPLLEGEAYKELKVDIEEQGLRQPIVLYEGRILDGRNRYRACLELDRDPQFDHYSGDSPIAFVWSMNYARRHLTAGQRAMVARKMLPMLREEAAKRQGTRTDLTPDLAGSDEFGESSEKAGQMVGVSASSVKAADALAAEDPELVARVERGEASLHGAVAQAKARRGRGKVPMRGFGEADSTTKAVGDSDALIGNLILGIADRVSQLGRQMGDDGALRGLGAVSRADAAEWAKRLEESASVIRRFRAGLLKITKGALAASKKKLRKSKRRA